MRKEFAAWMEARSLADLRTVFLTGDLGFMALENVQKAMGDRFVNMGVAEQNMISVAAGLAQQGLHPYCYSIAPFIVYRPHEQIRLDVCLHHHNVKIIGNGGGYGYGIMGATHHALEDLAVLSPLANMRCFVPYANEDVPAVCQAMAAYTGPAYLRLGFGILPTGTEAGQAYAPVRRLAAGDACTVVGIGPVILNALAALREMQVNSDVFGMYQSMVEGPGFGTLLRCRPLDLHGWLGRLPFDRCKTRCWKTRWIAPKSSLASGCPSGSGRPG